ncbi:hypothetical protein BABINDRAFT_163914 [Babjeviella inositovora NRRL Y-12698]|uniref:Serine/threonine-protein kinase RIO2 n=1 Tax=Babjeviella inositovora NRRL Y-12698 TaxID=984486 RepID=A0A1E3QH58_9ASCO|nr:uncharacterized protein BABINDRAFT_163914 [Babjeviella inositovora NRRL Y-12698]ODQ77021.1 hypothetical protein BABINDRAFT_163914 [Babjeviella inositovora NRRL Y-12698]
MTVDDFRVLTAVELGSRNHEVVPTKLIHQVGGLRSVSATGRCISDLAKLSLISKLRNAKYDGYRLSFSGYDYLALKSMTNRGTVYSVGNIIGVGKESDIYSTSDASGHTKVLKIHRLGRTSFRTVKNNRDYLRNKQTGNWMYLSRLAAEKEHQFMSVLHKNGFYVPTPYDWSRHCILMEWINGLPMRAVKKHRDYKGLYSGLMKFIVQLGNHGLIHCDYNEFNIIIRDEADFGKYESDFVVIDFPQCVSIGHVDAEFYFNRDVEGITTFFAKRFNYRPRDDSSMLDTDGFGEGFRYAKPDFKRDVRRIANLDVEVQASGYSKKKKNEEEEELEGALEGMRNLNVVEEEEEEEESQSEYDESEEESESDDDENERIISAISAGDGNLKMDKFGNYILDE